MPPSSTHRISIGRLVTIAGGFGLALGAAACGDYLSGPGLDTDPNNITTLSKPGPLYIAIQLAGGHEGLLGAAERLYMQQVAGVGRQQAQIDAYGGGLDEAALYGSAGLLDIRKLQQLARKLGDSLYIGIEKVYEALGMGYVADVWGDIPYREAADSNNLQPHFDDQLQVYADLQTQLDSAINIFLKATGPTNVGPIPDNAEFIYGGRDAVGLRAVYTAVARSLKARLFMHVAAASLAGLRGAPPAAYDSALKYATQGIGSPTDDFLQLPAAQVFNGSDQVPGAAIIEILKRRMAAGVEDTLRIAFYFSSTDGNAASSTGANFAGFRPTGATVPKTSGGVYDGSGPHSGFGAALDDNGDFRLPEITYAETQLIAAEAAWHINCPACDAATVVAAAQPFLDAARRDRHYGSIGSAPIAFGDAPGSLPATLQAIIEEKYLTLFLNHEVWNDWKRTCLPSLAPARGAAHIAGRLPYSPTEVDGNPNTPRTSSTGVTITSVSLNPNQPAACQVLNYTNSIPLAN